MDYKDYTERTERLEEQIKMLCAQKSDLTYLYIKEHLPFPFKKGQLIKVTLEVTEEANALYDKPRKVGSIYTMKDKCTGFIVGSQGELRPCFDKKSTYPLLDKIVSIEPINDLNDGKDKKK